VRLFFGGKLLRDNTCTLEELHIFSETTILCVRAADAAPAAAAAVAAAPAPAPAYPVVLGSEEVWQQSSSRFAMDGATPLLEAGGGAALVTLENFREHPLFTDRVERLREGETLRPPALPGLAIAAASPDNELGRGSFGAVLRGMASHPAAVAAASAQAVAVKLVHSFTNPGMYGLHEACGPAWEYEVSGLMKELNWLLVLQHPHVVQLHCFGLQTVLGVSLPGYIALQLCTEGTLAAWIRNGRLDAADVARFTQHLVDAMHYLHSLRIVHRDIKPNNIFVDRRRRVAAGCADGAGAGSGETLVLVIGGLRAAELLTHATGEAFTPAYMAPEVRITGECTFEADVYAVGCVVVEMLTRTCVHDAEIAAEWAAAAALCVKHREGAAALVAAKMAAAAAARRACVDDAARAVSVGAAVVVADDCWATQEMVARLAEAVAQERFDRCTFAELFALGEPKREQLRVTATAAAAAATEARKAREEMAAEVRVQVQTMLDEVQRRMSGIEAEAQQAKAEAQQAKADVEQAKAATVRPKSLFHIDRH
jgi:hypothetical protein